MAALFVMFSVLANLFICACIALLVFSIALTCMVDLTLLHCVFCVYFLYAVLVFNKE